MQTQCLGGVVGRARREGLCEARRRARARPAPPRPAPRPWRLRGASAGVAVFPLRLRQPSPALFCSRVAVAPAEDLRPWGG